MNDVKSIFLAGYNHYVARRPSEALACFDQVIRLVPDYRQARLNRVALLQDAQRYDEALLDTDVLLQQNPKDALAHAMRGRALLSLNRFEEALIAYAQVRAFDPAYPLDTYEEAFCRLSLGDYARGWPLQEARWQTPSMQAAAAQIRQRGYTQPLWLGQESIAGKTLFLWPEQGHGDSMQFSRYAIVARQMGAHVVLATNQGLLRLFKQSFEPLGIEVVLDLVGHPYAFDLHCPMMSLPLACGTDDLRKIPVTQPYLFADPASVQAQAQVMAGQAPRVGLVWAGGVRPNQPELYSVDAARSLKLAQFAPLLALAQTGQVRLFSLQLGEPAAQLQSHMPLTDLTAQLRDWADTAAAVANLDLVITCDTAVAHLAAAMGKPTWVLSRFNGCWRWLTDRDDSPWYPSVRLFRQTTRGDWASVVARVVTALQAALGQ